jgi:hypothetical protein
MKVSFNDHFAYAHKLATLLAERAHNVQTKSTKSQGLWALICSKMALASFVVNVVCSMSMDKALQWRLTECLGILLQSTRLGVSYSALFLLLPTPRAACLSCKEGFLVETRKPSWSLHTRRVLPKRGVLLLQDDGKASKYSKSLCWQERRSWKSQVLRDSRVVLRTLKLNSTWNTHPIFSKSRVFIWLLNSPSTGIISMAVTPGAPQWSCYL